MEFPFISATLASFLLVLQQGLMMSVGFHRMKTEVGVGFAEDQHLERKMRRHGNLAENGALLIVVLALTEMSGASSSVVTGFAMVFALARISHALGFSSLDGTHNLDGNKAFVALRMAGATGTGWGGLGLGGYLAYSLMAA